MCHYPPRVETRSGSGLSLQGWVEWGSDPNGIQGWMPADWVVRGTGQAPNRNRRGDLEKGLRPHIAQARQKGFWNSSSASKRLRPISFSW